MLTGLVPPPIESTFSSAVAGSLIVIVVTLSGAVFFFTLTLAKLYTSEVSS